MSDQPVGEHHERTSEHTLIRHWRLTLFFLTVVGFCLSPVPYRGDAYLSVHTATALVRNQTLDLASLPLETIPPGLEYTVNAYPPGKGPHPALWVGPRQGWRYYDYFPWTTSLFMVPTVVAADSLNHVGVSRFDPDRLIAGKSPVIPQIVTASIWSAVGVLVLAILVWNLLEGMERSERDRAALLGGLVIAFGTYAWSIFSRGLTSQTPNFIAVSVALLAATKLDNNDRHSSRWAIVLGAAVALSLTFRPSSVAIAVAVGIWLLATRPGLLTRVGAGASAVGVPYVAVNIATFGSIVPPYFSAGRAIVQPQALEALAANLISPSRGLFVTLPLAVFSVIGAVLVLRGRHEYVSRSLGLALTGSVIAVWVLVSVSGRPWWAGDSFGSRYLADTLPQLVVLALPAVVSCMRVSTPKPVRAAGVALLTVSILINSQAGLSRPVACWNKRRGAAIATHTDRVWSVTDPQWTSGVKTLIRTGSPREAVLGCDADLPEESLYLPSH